MSLSSFKTMVTQGPKYHEAMQYLQIMGLAETLASSGANDVGKAIQDRLLRGYPPDDESKPEFDSSE